MPPIRMRVAHVRRLVQDARTHADEHVLFSSNLVSHDSRHAVLGPADAWADAAYVRFVRAFQDIYVPRSGVCIERYVALGKAHLVAAEAGGFTARAAVCTESLANTRAKCIVYILSRRFPACCCQGECACEYAPARRAAGDETETPRYPAQAKIDRMVAEHDAFMQWTAEVGFDEFGAGDGRDAADWKLYASLQARACPCAEVVMYHADWEHFRGPAHVLLVSRIRDFFASSGCGGYFVSHDVHDDDVCEHLDAERLTHVMGSRTYADMPGHPLEPVGSSKIGCHLQVFFFHAALPRAKCGDAACGNAGASASVSAGLHCPSPALVPARSG